MRKFIVLPLLVLLAACTERTAVGPDGDPGFVAAKGGKGKGGGGGGGDADGGYTITDLGTLFGGKKSSSRARDISEPIVGPSQQTLRIVGRSGDGSGNTAATLWTVTLDWTVAVTAMDPPPVGLSPDVPSEAWAINGSGNIVVGSAGGAGSGTARIPVRWTFDGSSWASGEELTVSAEFSGGYARDVNDAGLIVGWRVGESEDWAQKRRATLWRSEDPVVVVELPSLAPVGTSTTPRAETNARAEAINDAASENPVFVAGNSGIWIDDHLLFHAVLWKVNGTEVEGPCDLHTWEPAYGDGDSPQGGDVLHSHVWGISDANTTDGSVSVQVVGSRTLYGGEGRATVWTVDVGNTKWTTPSVLCKMVDELPGDLGSAAFALDINNTGVVVGQDHSSGNVRPVLWTAGGQPVNLPSLKGDYGSAEGINDAGLIVGWTKAGGHGQNHAVLWTKN